MRPVFLDLYACLTLKRRHYAGVCTVSKDLQESLQKGFECKVQLEIKRRGFRQGRGLSADFQTLALVSSRIIPLSHECLVESYIGVI